VKRGLAIEVPFRDRARGGVVNACFVISITVYRLVTSARKNVSGSRHIGAGDCFVPDDYTRFVSHEDRGLIPKTYWADTAMMVKAAASSVVTIEWVWYIFIWSKEF